MNRQFTRHLTKAAWAISLLTVSIGALPVDAQSLLSRLRWQRTQEIATEHFERAGYRMSILGTDPFALPTDSLRNALRDLKEKGLDTTNADLPGFTIDSLLNIGPDDVPRYADRFQSTDWAFLGSSSVIEIDTMLTRDIRSRMQHHFGSPALTALDRERLPQPDSMDTFQFEYWFIINGSIPAYVLDVNGPWDRGVVFAAPSEHRSMLEEMKSALFRQLIRTRDRKPFADYYFNAEQGIWYVTLYDGASFLDVRTVRPSPGQERPTPGEAIRQGSAIRQ